VSLLEPVEPLLAGETRPLRSAGRVGPNLSRRDSPNARPNSHSTDEPGNERATPLGPKKIDDRLQLVQILPLLSCTAEILFKSSCRPERERHQI